MPIYRPPTAVISYAAFMKAVGQGDDYKVARPEVRDQVHWKPTETGYWFGFETSDVGLRTEGLLELETRFTPPSIEEYTIAWYAIASMYGKFLDLEVSCYTRTRFGKSGVLIARAGVHKSPPDYRVWVESVPIALSEAKTRSPNRSGRHVVLMGK